jgi:hypothetical protein
MLEVANKIAISTLAKVEAITLTQINVKAFRLYTSNSARQWDQKGSRYPPGQAVVLESGVKIRTGCRAGREPSGSFDPAALPLYDRDQDAQGEDNPAAGRCRGPAALFDGLLRARQCGRAGDGMLRDNAVHPGKSQPRLLQDHGFRPDAERAADGTRFTESPAAWSHRAPTGA